QKRSPASTVSLADRTYDDTRSISPATMRLHRAADGFILFAKPIAPQEEELLLKQGFQAEKRAQLVRDRSIHNHEVYLGYSVGAGDPWDDKLTRLQGTMVNMAFKAYRGVGSPMIVDVAPHRQ